MDFNMYNKITSMNKKLFCTFTPKENLNPTLEIIKSEFSLTYNTIFVLDCKNSNEYALTYNIEDINIKNPLSNTILVHRKKDYNTLYSLNALNCIIKSVNNGILDKSIIIPWDLYKNCILLTEGDNLRRLNTKIHKVVKF